MHQVLHLIIIDDDQPLIQAAVDALEAGGQICHASSLYLPTLDNTSMCCSASDVTDRLLQLVDFIIENNATDPDDLEEAKRIINDWAEEHRGNKA